MSNFNYPLILDGGFATELERTFGKDLSGKKTQIYTNHFGK